LNKIFKSEVKKMTPFERIELNPRVCNGKPVVKGTRIPVTVILEGKNGFVEKCQG
jgi:uncharacterized protein (DUF433 family)